jgi:hypothetical protein
MKKPIIITVLLLLSSLSIYAQDNKKPQPDSLIKIIPFGEGKHSSYLYTIGGKLQTREDVQVRLMRYAPSAVEYSKGKTNATWGYISFGGTALSLAAATIEYATHNKHVGETTGIVNGQAAFIYQHHSLAGAYILTGIATGFLTSAIINLMEAGKHGDKALKLYNQQYE